MNEQQKRNYRERMFVAQLFLSFLKHDGERARLMKLLGVTSVPVIVPALADTSASSVREAAGRYCASDAQCVIVPVMLPVCETTHVELCALIVSTSGAGASWQLDMSELHDGATMSQVIDAVDANKKWVILISNINGDNGAGTVTLG